MRRFANSLTKKAPYKETAYGAAGTMGIWGLQAGPALELEPMQRAA